MEEKKLAKQITFEESMGTIYVEPTNEFDLLYVSEYYGDHSENWIVKISKDGKTEYGRYNTKCLTSIEWVDKV